MPDSRLRAKVIPSAAPKALPVEPKGINGDKDDEAAMMGSMDEMAEKTERSIKIAEEKFKKYGIQTPEGYPGNSDAKRKGGEISEGKGAVAHPRYSIRRDRQRQQELELQIKACDDRIARDEEHVKKEEDQMKNLKDRIHHDAVTLKATNDIIESKKLKKSKKTHRISRNSDAKRKGGEISEGKGAVAHPRYSIRRGQTKTTGIRYK